MPTAIEAPLELRLSILATAGSTNGGHEVEDLHTVWQFDQELGVTLQMVNASRVFARKPRHRLHTFPVRNRYKLAFVAPILAQHLHAQCLLRQRPNALFIEVSGVLVGPGCSRATAPDARDCGTENL